MKGDKMDIEKFSDLLVRLNTTIEKYLKAKKARELVSQGHNLCLDSEIIITIVNIIDEKIDQYERQIIGQATKLTQVTDDNGQKEN